MSPITSILSPLIDIMKYLAGEADEKSSRRDTMTMLIILVMAAEYVGPLVVSETSYSPIFLITVFLAALMVMLFLSEKVKAKRWLFYFYPFIVAILISGGAYAYSFYTNNFHHIAPSMMQFGSRLPYTTTYGTNARILEAKLYKRAQPLGPEEFIRLKFQLFCKGVEDNCSAGWLAGNLYGLESSNSARDIVFEIRGAEGNEVVGISLKDKAWTEIDVSDIGKYTADNRITTDWQTVRIPLIEFGRVDLTNLDVLTFFADARFSSYSVIDVDIANIRIE